MNNLSHILFAILCIVIAAISFGQVNESDYDEDQPKRPAFTEQQPDLAPPVPTYNFDKKALQDAVDSWVQSSSASYGVVVQDPDTGKVLVSSNPNQTYFSASLYKLYIAFLAWQDIESGVLVPEQSFFNDMSTERCLDLMIRESDSPCGEAVLALYDYQEAQDRLKALDLPDIDMPGFRVSAADMAVLLQHVYDQELINDVSARSIRASMQDQIYASGLKRGFSSYIVQDKVGFSEQVDWHDVGFVQNKEGKWLIVSVLSQGARSQGVFGLAAELKQLF